jgi:diguanylate cyclase (GGDEF)-like protein
MAVAQGAVSRKLTLLAHVWPSNMGSQSRVELLSPQSFLFSSMLTSTSILVLAVLIRPGLEEDKATLAWWIGGDLAKIASRMPPLLQCALLGPGCGVVGGHAPALVFVPTCFCLVLGLALQTKALARLCHVHIGNGRMIGLLAGVPVAVAAATAMLPSLGPLLIAMAAGGLTLLQMAIIWRETSTSRALTIMAAADAIIVVFGVVFIARIAAGATVPGQPTLLALIPDFVASIAATIMMLVALEERERAMVSRMSTTDQLTGTLNRRGFIPLLDRAWRSTNRLHGPLSLAILDIDHFKRINDTFGHDKGDAVLAAFAGALTTLCRDRDRVARWGGEEFLLLMPQTPAHGAVVSLKRIRAALPARLKGCAPCAVTFSAGIYECADFSDVASIDALVARADNCLYKAKIKRDCIVSEPPEPEPYDTSPHLAGMDL